MLALTSMDKLRKKKLINYLYYNKHVAEFMYNDLYVELNYVLPKKICFSNENFKKENRVKNFEKAIGIIKNFLKENVIYYNKLKEFYAYKDLNVLVKDILVGYIMFLTPHINKNSGADVYADKRSVCYSRVSILDLNI